MRISPRNGVFHAILNGFIVMLTVGYAAWAQGQAGEVAQETPLFRHGREGRLTDGHPDLNGVWDFRAIVRLQRLKELAGKERLTDEDVVRIEEQSRAHEEAADRFPYAPHNRFWFDEGTTVAANKRTSVITDPADGRLPPLAPEGQRRANTEPWNRNPRTVPRVEQSLEGPEDLDVASRCFMGFNAGPPMLPGSYNNIMQLYQTSDYVVINTEMIHTARIVPLDGRPHLTIPQWSGSSRGHWEEDTLVVETKNFNDRGVGSESFTTDANMDIVERFRRFDADTLSYEFTVTDPTVWTRPWSGLLFMTRTSERVYEYACHEGNYSLPNMLAGARATERAASEKK